MRVAMILVALGLTTATWGDDRPICDVGAPHAGNPAETAQFEFMLGTHEVTLHAWQAASSNWTPPRPINAEWNGYWGLDGAAIVDEWFDPPSSPDDLAARGVNVRIYDPASAEWKMMWVARPGYQVQDLRAKVEPDGLTMWQVYPERANWKAVFEILDERRWARTSYQRATADADWQPQFRLVATRTCRVR